MSLLEEMSGGATTDFTDAEEFTSDQLNGTPVGRLRQKMFGLGEHAAFEAFGLAFLASCSLKGEIANVREVTLGFFPGVVAGQDGFCRDAAEGDQDLTFDPVFRRTEDGLAELTDAEVMSGW